MDAERDAEMDAEMGVDEGNEGKGVALVQGVGAGGESVGGAHARAGRPFTLRDCFDGGASPRETPQIRTLAPAQGYIPPRRVTPQGSRRGVRGGGGRPRGHAPRGTRTEARPRVDGGVLGRRRRRRRTPDLVRKPAMQAGTAAVAVGRGGAPRGGIRRRRGGDGCRGGRGGMGEDGTRHAHPRTRRRRGADDGTRASSARRARGRRRSCSSSRASRARR